MIWTLVAFTFIVIGWYWFEGRWDRRLFRSEPGCVCVNVHPKTAMAFLESHQDTQVLDVRSDAEFSAGALPGAIHISIGDEGFLQKAGKLDKRRPVLVYCAGGYRSRKAVEMLKAQGFANIQHLHRGFHSWQFAGFPIMQSKTETSVSPH